MSTLAQINFEADVLPTSAGNLTMTFIGHGTLMFEMDGKTIHVDPYGSAPSEARRFLQGESPCRVRTSHPLVPSVGTVEEESHPNDIV